MTNEGRMLPNLIEKALTTDSLSELPKSAAEAVGTSVCFKDSDGSVFTESDSQEFVQSMGSYPLQELQRNYTVIKLSDTESLLGHLILPRKKHGGSDALMQAAVLAFRVFCTRTKAERERKFMLESDILQRFLTRKLRFEKVQNEFRERPFPLEGNSMVVVLGLKLEEGKISPYEHEAMAILDEKFSRFFKRYVSWREKRKTVIALTPQFPMDEKAATDFIVSTIENMKNNNESGAVFTNVCAGFGTAKNEIQNLPESFEEADRAFRVACLTFGIWWRKWRELGALRLLMFLADNKESDLFIESTLGRLVDNGEIQDSQILLETLKVLDNNLWNLKQTSLFLNLHYNTMKYRYQKIQDSLGMDLNSSNTRFNISLALRLLSLKGNK